MYYAWRLMRWQCFCLVFGRLNSVMQHSCRHFFSFDREFITSKRLVENGDIFYFYFVPLLKINHNILMIVIIDTDLRRNNFINRRSVDAKVARVQSMPLLPQTIQRCWRCTTTHRISTYEREIFVLHLQGYSQHEGRIGHALFAPSSWPQSHKIIRK